MTFANPLPWWAFVLVSGAAAALAWHAYRGFSAWPARRGILSTLRFVTLLAIVIVLMRPVVRITQADERDVVVPVLIDISRSMAIEDAEGSRRLDRAREILKEQLLPALSARFQVDVLSFGEGLAPVDPAALNATARRTDIAGAFAAARERYRGRPVAGFVLVTDGGDTGGALDLDPSTETLPPVFAIPIGSADAGRDREVLSVTAAESVLDDSRVDLAVSAVAHGADQTPIELRLLENGRPIDVRHVRPPSGGGPVHAVFQVAPPPGGGTIYTAEIPADAAELVPENNRRSVLVQPPSRARRVLIVEGAPGYEHSFLRRALAGDRGIEVDAVVRKGKNEQGQDTFYVQGSRERADSLTSGYPRDEAALFKYDALVLANVGGELLTGLQMDATREFVNRRGGGLIVLGAQSFLNRGLAGSPVESVLPIDLNRRVDTAVASAGAAGANRIALTDAGLDHPVTRLGGTPEDTRKRWEALPSLAASAVLGTTRPGGAVLATTSGSGGVARPLIAVQRYGEGRSMVFAGEASWRWRMMLPSSDRSYETFWRQTLRWLALSATDPVAVYPGTAGGPGDELTVRAAVRDAAFMPVHDAEVDVRIAGPDGRMQDVRARPEASEVRDSPLFAARFTPEQPGLHRVTVTARRGGQPLGSATRSTLVGGADLEMTDPRVNRALLERIAAASGGRVLASVDAPALVEALRAGIPAAALAVQKDLWHNAWSLLLLLGLLASEWILRRRWGLR